jgi:cytochrome c oxidase subunit 2
VDSSAIVSDRRRTAPGRLGRLVAGSSLTLVLAVAAVACGSDADQAGSGAAPASAATDAAAYGEQLSRSSGCAGCHGANFGGGAGPGWIGLAGSERELTDGSVVIADTEYLIRAIADPAAELVADYTLRMPANNLSDDEIAAIVAFIESLDG